MTCHSYKKYVFFLREDLNKLLLLTLMWTFILKDLRFIPFTEQCQQRRPQQQREQQQEIHKNPSNYTINNKNMSDSIIRISNNNTSNSQKNKKTAIVTTMTTVTVFIVKTIAKTITRVVETLSTLAMILRGTRLWFIRIWKHFTSKAT